MKVFLFANHGYGAPFTREAVATAQRMGMELVIVRSTASRHARAPRIRQRVREFVRRRLDGIRYGVRVVGVANVNGPEFLQHVRSDDIGVIAGFNQIFSSAAIDRFREIVNFHPSILPRYRGPVPSYWTVHNGETASGYTLHRISCVIDQGDVLYQEVVPIASGSTPDAIDADIARAGAPTLSRYLIALMDGDAWQAKVVDAASVYRAGHRYQSFPGK